MSLRFTAFAETETIPRREMKADEIHAKLHPSYCGARGGIVLKRERYGRMRRAL